MTSEINYLGDLRTTCVHLLSGQSIITDAPLDNQGKGEAFSPTDLTATSLAACILTTMGIVARRDNMTDIDGAKATCLKVMSSEGPRRIVRIVVDIYFPKDRTYNEKEREVLERTAHTCPVARSLHPDIEQALTLHFD
jgi:putative redox protein